VYSQSAEHATNCGEQRDLDAAKMLRGQPWSAGERIAGVTSGTWMMQERASGRASNGTSHWKLFLIRNNHGLSRVGRSRVGRQQWRRRQVPRVSSEGFEQHTCEAATRAMSIPLCKPIFCTDFFTTTSSYTPNW